MKNIHFAAPGAAYGAKSLVLGLKAYFYPNKILMKKIVSTSALRLLLLALPVTAGLLTTSCKKDAPAVVAQDYSAADEITIKKYLADNMITTAQKQPSGLYYVPVVTDASALRATAGKTVYVRYVGKYLDGRVFDSSGSAPFSFVLGRGRVIPGWDEGIALMHKGDKAKLLIPSALAYGSSGAGSIPPNTVLYFDVELTEIL